MNAPSPCSLPSRKTSWCLLGWISVVTNRVVIPVAHMSETRRGVVWFAIIRLAVRSTYVRPSYFRVRALRAA
jgi:hypothetical protein